MGAYNRFDLEQQIIGCWNIDSDITTLKEGMLRKQMSVDEVSNVILGIKCLYQLKFEKLYVVFQDVSPKEEDLNSFIKECEQVIADIDNLFVKVCDKLIEYDEVVKLLDKLVSVYEAKFNKLFCCFEFLVNEDKI